MRVGPKLLALFFIVGIIPLVILGWYVKTLSEASFMTETFAKLESIRQIKKSTLEKYFVRYQTDARTLVNAIIPMRDHAVERLEMTRTEVQRDVENYFNNMKHDILLMQDDLYLHDTFGQVYKAFEAVGNKVGSPEWNALVAQLEHRIGDIVNDNGLDDLLLVSLEGEIVYSLGRKSDLGQNLDQGALRETPLGQAVHQLQSLHDPDAVVFSDFAPYAPAGGVQSAFVVARMKQLGYVVFRFGVTRINAIVQAQLVKSEGDAPLTQKKTLEILLAGRAQGTVLLRSDRTLAKKSFGQKQSSLFLDKGLAGESGTKISMNEAGIMEFVSYSPLNLPGLNWAVLVTRSVDEAMSLVENGRNGVFLQRYAKDYGYHDLLLVGHNGLVFYSIGQEADLGTNVLDGEYSNTNMAQMVRQVMKTHQFGMTDFVSYAPSGGKPSAFMAMPILQKGEDELVVVLQLSLDEIQKIMDEREGMGKSGESYLVGPDKRMRSSSYEDPMARSVLASFAGDVKNNGVDTEGVSEALAGQIGIKVFETYNSHQVLAAFSPIQFGQITWALLVEIDLEEVHAPIDAIFQGILLAGLILIGVVVGIALLTTRGMVRPLQGLMSAAGQIASGDRSARVAVMGGGEFGDLGRIFNLMAESNEEQFWLQTNLAHIASLVQQSKTPKDLVQRLMSELVPLMKGGHGAIYVHNAKSGRYELLASYGFKVHKNLNSSFVAGEGLVGQCVWEKRSILITDAPRDYIKINSGLGESSPVQILLAPMIFQEMVVAVIEIATFGEFTAMQHSLMEALQGPLGLGLENLHRSQQTQELLEETQAQSEELSTQQEELKRSNEELQHQAEELRASEEELQSQQDELEASNQTLRAQKAVLEKSQAELEDSRRLIEEKAKDLTRASQYKSEFLANMSHELRTPLNSLLILSRLFYENRDGNLSHAQVESARMIHSSGSELLELINDILDLSKIEAGKMAILVEDLHLSELRDRIAGQFAHMAKDKGLEFKVELALDAPLSIRTDEGKMGRILKNFLSNAFKFTEKGLVSVRIGKAWEDRRVTEGEVRLVSGDVNVKKAVFISVSDTGIGIAQDKLQLVFDAFQQADGGTSRKYGGTGLGLSIARELARLLHGELRLKSEVGKGSVFTLLLPEIIAGDEGGIDHPVSPSPPQNRINPPIVAQQRAVGDITALATVSGAALGDFILDDRAQIQNGDKVLLVIEDDPRFATVVCALARQRGYKCLAAPDGESGLALAMCYHPMGVILDRTLEGLMDGDAVLARMQENPATNKIPVHVIAGKENGFEALMKQGAVGVLAKPVSEAQLRKVFGRIECAAGKNLLLVEDDPSSAKATAAFFHSQGVEVTAIHDGEGALQLLKERTFNCMVLDLDLPGISGFDLLGRLASEATLSRPPVIVYSGRELSREEYSRLRHYTDSVVMKGADSGERLMNEVGLFLSGVEGVTSTEAPVLTDASLFAGEKILLVDDDMRNIFAMSKMLQSQGLRVIMAPDGRRSLELLDKNTDIKVVLMDVMMPVMDGLEAVRLIREQARFKSLPIVILSAKAMPEDREKGLAAGANAFLAKPVNTDQLILVLREYLSGANRD